MITIPYIVETPDLIRIEALQLSPGRPLPAGVDRLVRPDGTVSMDYYGDLPVAGLTPAQIKEKAVLFLRRQVPAQALGLLKEDEKTGQPRVGEDGKPILLPPAESNAVFVDVVSFNSKVYYVQGDVSVPGRFPCTGHETVLDALNLAGGLAATADERDIRYVRATRGDQPAKVFPVDLKAIVERGDPATNYQIFPGDRVVVARHPDVKAPVELNRRAQPISTTPTQRDALLQDRAESWRPKAPGGAAIDEATLRDSLIRKPEHGRAPDSAPKPTSSATSLPPPPPLR